MGATQSEEGHPWFPSVQLLRVSYKSYSKMELFACFPELKDIALFFILSYVLLAL